MFKSVLTTGDIANHCHVSQETVANWIRRGRLKAYATPGRHRRVQLVDFRRFLSEHGMPPVDEDRPQNRRVLVVDDDPSITRMIVDFLDKEGGFDLATAEDGFGAGVQTAIFHPDLMILDLMMPNLDGFAVCERIKSSPETKRVSVLVMTGYSNDENVSRALRSGADYCLAKPFSVHQLKAKIEELIPTTAAWRRPAPVDDR